MLPFSTFEPIQINIEDLNLDLNLNLNPTATNKNPSSNHLSLFPITVEFDRLFRRQQQQNLRRKNQNIGKLDSKGIQQSQLPRSLSSTSTSSGSSGFSSTNFNHHQEPQSWLKTSKTSTTTTSILDDCNDVHQLLYATIIHYRAALDSAENSTFLNGRKGSNDQEDDQQTANLYRTLTTPGTRTMLLLAKKNDIFQHLRLQIQRKNLHSKRCSSEHQNQMADSIEEMPVDFEQSETEPSSIVNNNNSVASNISCATTTDGCITKDIEEDIDDSQPKSTKERAPVPQNHSRREKIQKLINGTFNDNFNENNNDNFSLRFSSKNKVPKNKNWKKKFLSDLDHFLNNALERKCQLVKWTFYQDDDEKIDDNSMTISMIGLEQQIIGAVTFYKSYRLESVKIMEIAMVAVQRHFQRLGIGTRLLKLLKEMSQIGPYDSMHVQVPTMNEHQPGILLKFFLKNDFTDDLILNAGFDQLIIRSTEESNQNDDQNGDNTEEDDDIEVTDDETGSNDMARLGTITSKKHQSYRLHSNHHRTISMCYLPPFSVGTLSESMSTSSSSNYGTLEKMDHKFVDDIIDQANMVWRRSLLSAYRTQWSCVARLRSEITRLRQQLAKSDQTIDQLRRENFQLRNALVQKNRTLSNNSNGKTNNSLQKQLLLYSRNFRLDNSLDF